VNTLTFSPVDGQKEHMQFPGAKSCKELDLLVLKTLDSMGDARFGMLAHQQVSETCCN